MSYYQFLFLLILVFLNSCSSYSKPNLKELNGKNIIVFVPGYKGSRLVNSSGDTVWLSFRQLIFGSDSIAYGSKDNLKVDGVLKEIEVIPYIYSIDIYREFLDKLNSIEDYQVIEFAYDWRDSNIITASKLRDFVKKIEKSKPKSISIIAHSMGGLSVAYALGYSEPLNLDKVIFVGTLFRGTLKAFLDMNRKIEPLPFDESFFTREDYISFRSAYEFLPHPDDASFSDTTQKNKDTIFKLENWAQNSWGLYKNKKEEHFMLLKENLERAKNFYDSFEYISVSCPNSSILNIQGVGLPVQAKYSLQSSRAGKFNDQTKVSYQDGDSLVTLESSTLPSSLRKCNYQDIKIPDVIHDRMFDDKRVVKKIKSFLLN